MKERTVLFTKKYARVPFTGTSKSFFLWGGNGQTIYKDGDIESWKYYYENGQLISAKYMYECEEREERIYDYICSEDILIPNVGIISHRKPVATSEGTKNGFIHLLCKYPIFPKRNKEEIELSKEALVRYQDFINYDYDEVTGRSMKMPILLGVIKKHKDILKYKDDLLDLDILNDLFENNVSLYQYDGWMDDSNWGYKDEGIEFKWHYPWFFHISDEGLKNCAQEIWSDFLNNYFDY